MSLDLSNRIILITGATGGVGQEIARQAAAAGAQLILHGRNAEALSKLDDELHEKYQTESILWPLDLLLANEQTIRPTVDELSQHIQRIDMVFHCAVHIGQQSPILQEPHDTWQKVMQVNVEAPRLLLREIFHLLQASESAKNYFLIDEKTDSLYQGAFSASKQLLLHLAKQLNLEFEKINNIKTELLTLPPLYSALRAKGFPGESPEQNISPSEAVQHVFEHIFK